MSQFFCFGDSIAYGDADPEFGGWVTRLRLMLVAKDPDATVYNLGIPGDTTDGLSARFESEVKARYWAGDPVPPVFLFAFGANDAAWDSRTQAFRVPEARFIANLERVIGFAKKLGGKVAFLAITPVDEACTATPPAGEKVRRNEWVEQYNVALETLSRNESVEFIDAYRAFRGAEYQELLADGVHPNAAGHRLLCELVWGSGCLDGMSA